MHILHVVQLYWPAPSGAARYFQEIGKRLVAEGHRVTVLATDAFDLEHLWMAGKRRIPEPVGEHDASLYGVCRSDGCLRQLSSTPSSAA